MAAPQRITRTNFATTLKQSTQPRSGIPDGNVYFGKNTGLLQLITVEELPLIDLGSGPEANPLTNALGAELVALYNFELQERRLDETLRGVLPFIAGSYIFAGAYELVNGRLLDSTDGSLSSEYQKIRGSGLIARAEDRAINRIYFGVRSLNNVEAGSVPFYQLSNSSSAADRQLAAPVNFSRPGPIDEMIQVFGSTANGDTNAGDFDFTARLLILGLRTFGFTVGTANSVGTGLASLNGFSTGFGLGEAPSATSDFTLVDVFGGAAIAPFTGLSYTGFDTPQVISGFTSGSAQFSDIIANTEGASLAQIRAWLDALMLQDTDQDVGLNDFIPKRAEPLYTIDPNTSNLITRQGLYIQNIPSADLRNIVFTDDAGTQQTTPIELDIRVTVDAFWLADALGWYHCFIQDGPGLNDFNTENAITFVDTNSNEVKGTPSDAVNGEIRFTAAESEIGQFLVFLAEGDGGATAGRVTIELTNEVIIRAAVSSGQETNA